MFNKKILFVFIFLLFVPTHAFSYNKLFSTDQTGAWTACKNSNNTAWQYIVNNQDSGGLISALHYLMDGDAGSASSAYSTFSWISGRSAAGSSVSRDWLRDHGVRAALTFSWVCHNDGLGASTCDTFYDRLNYLADAALNDTDPPNSTTPANGGATFPRIHGTRRGDSDELIGQTMFLKLFALAIEDEQPARAAEILNWTGDTDPEGGTNTGVGGLDIDNAASGSLSAQIYYYVNRFLSGGEWIESENYNKNTLVYLLIGAKTINDFCEADSYCSGDQSEVITGEYTNIANALVQNFNADFSDRMEWGDIDAQNVGQLFKYKFAPLLSTVATIASHQRAMYAFNQVSGGTFSQLDNYWVPFYDSSNVSLAPSGQTSHYADGYGFMYWHEGWNSGDTAFMSMIRPLTGIHHSSDAFSSFVAFKGNNDQFIDHVNGYYDPLAENGYLNTMRANGEAPGPWSEAKDALVGTSGSSFAYSVGTSGGQEAYDGFYGPPSEWHKESTHSHFFINNSDETDVVVLFYRIYNCDPREVTCINNWWEMNKSSGKIYYNKVNNNGARNQFLLQTPAAASQNGNVFTYTADTGETVTLTAFETPDSVANTDMGPSCSSTTGYGLEGGTFKCSELRNRLTLGYDAPATLTLNTYGYTVASGNVTVNQIDSNAGTNTAYAIRVLSSTEEKVVVFSATDNGVEPNTPKDGAYADHDPEKINRIATRRLFNGDFQIAPTLAGTTDFFVVDLDTQYTWKLQVNGGSATTITPNSAGLAQFTVSEGAGTHTIYIYADGQSQETCSDAPALCADQTACEAAGWCWDGNNCVSACAGDGCDDYCSLCEGEEACNGSALTCYYYDSTCNANPQPSCSTQYFELCITQIECEAPGVNGNWCDDDGNLVFECQISACANTEFEFEDDPDCLVMYNFSEITGDLIDICTTDSASNNGTISDMTTRSGATYTFDGSDDYVSISHQSEIDFADEDFTVCMKVKMNSLSGTQTYFQKGNGETSGVRYSMFLSGSEIVGSIDDDLDKSDASWTHDLETSVDYYFCFVRDVVENKVYLYRNGVAVAVQTDVTGSIAGQNSRDLMIGAYCSAAGGCPHSTDPYHPSITMDDFFILGRAMSPGEMQTWIDGGGLDESGDQPAPTVEKKLIRGATTFLGSGTF